MPSPRSSVNTSFSLILSDNKEFLRAYVVQLAPQPFAPGLQHSSKVALPVTCWRTAAWTKPSCCRNSAFRALTAAITEWAPTLRKEEDDSSITRTTNMQKAL